MDLFKFVAMVTTEVT